MKNKRFFTARSSLCIMTLDIQNKRERIRYSMKNLSKSERKMFLVMLCVSFMTGGFGKILTNILSSLAEIYPDVSSLSIYKLYSLPTLVTTVCTLILGPLVGRKINYKQMFSIGLVLLLVGGFGPAIYIKSFAFTMFCRILVGIGVSFCNFINGSYVYTFGAEKGTRLLALSSSLTTGFQVISLNVAGYLATSNVALAFTPYALTSIVLFLVLRFYHDPDSADQTKPAADAGTPAPQTAEKAIPPLRAFVYPLIMFLFILVQIVPYSNISFVITDKGLGTVAAVSLVSSCSSIGYFLTGLFYGKLEEKLNRFMLPIAMLLTVAFIALNCYGPNIWCYYLAYLLYGSSMAFYFSTLYKYAGVCVTGKQFGLITSILMAAGSVSSYVAPYFMTLCSMFADGDMVYFPQKVTLIIASVMAVLFLVRDVRPKELRKS